MVVQNPTQPSQGPFFDQVLIQAAEKHAPAQSPLEQFFASHGGETAGAFPPQAGPRVAPVPASSPPKAIPLGPPSRPAAPSGPGTVTELAAEYEWLREERKRLETYTLEQLTLISKQREDLASRRAGVEATFALREQELNRNLKILAERAEVVEQRERSLAANEAALAINLEEAAQLEQQHHQLLKTNSKLQKDIEENRLLLQHLRLQAGQAEESLRATKTEVLAFERVQENRKAVWEEEQAQFQARQEQLERRFSKLDKAEESLRRREQELEELEAQLRCEIEQREQELTIQHRELEKLQAGLRSPSKTLNV